MQKVVTPTAPEASAPLGKGATKPLDRSAASNMPPDRQHGRVVACIDRSGMDSKVVAHAQAIARRLNAGLVLAQVLESPSALDGPQDPLSWKARRRKCRERFKWLVREHSSGAVPEQILLEGKAAEQLANWVAHNGAALLVFAKHGEDWTAGAGLGSTAKKLLRLAPSSLLLIPPYASETPAYARILVALDGSGRAESVLPSVISLAKEHGSEISLVYVVCQPQLIEAGPLEPEAIALRDQLIRRNEQVARTYLDRVTGMLTTSGIEARSIIAHGDPRERLQQIAADEKTDLIVLAAQGQSGRTDMCCGSVTSYLADHAMVPLLIVHESHGAAG